MVTPPQLLPCTTRAGLAARVRMPVVPTALTALVLSLTVVGATAKDLGGGWEEKRNEEGKVVQQLKIEAPSFTEEDQYGYVMPDRYKCDSCRAVMFHLDQDLRKKQPKSRRMKAWEYTDVFEDTCRGAFQGYGIKLINGENTLSGPGLTQSQEQLAPGSGAIQMGGDSWTKRLGEICRKIVYEKVGEDEVYEKFYQKFKAEDGKDVGLGLSEALCASDELRECVTGPKPPPKPKTQPPAEGKAKPEKPKAAKKEKASKATSGRNLVEAPTPPRTNSGGSSSSGGTVAGERIDVQTFLRNLAVKHGLTSDEYLAARTESEWEKLTVAITGRIFNRVADAEVVVT